MLRLASLSFAMLDIARYDDLFVFSRGRFAVNILYYRAHLHLEKLFETYLLTACNISTSVSEKRKYLVAKITKIYQIATFADKELLL